jgi:hypothetical protein
MIVWEIDALPRDFLQAVTQHRSIDLFQNVSTDLDEKLGCDPKDMTVEGGVMQLAQSDAIWNHWLTTRVPVGKNVRRLQQLRVTQMADRAVLPICAQNTLAEGLLMQTADGENR